MNQEDLEDLRAWRDTAEGEDKRLLRKAIDAIQAARTQMSEARTLIRAALRALDVKE